MDGTMNSHPTYPVSSTKRGCAAHHRFAVRVPPPSGVGRKSMNILTYDRIATQMESYLVTMGYRLQKDALTKYATRFENPAHDKVDILVTDYQYSAGCP